jgi:hypothetical protein
MLRRDETASFAVRGLEPQLFLVRTFHSLGRGKTDSPSETPESFSPQRGHDHPWNATAYRKNETTQITPSTPSHIA